MMNTEKADAAVQALYKAVDRKDANYLAEVLGDEVRFQLGNFPTVAGKAEVLDANRGFFNSIESMRHTLDKTWQVGEETICCGEVNYVRLDKTTYQARFATVLRWHEGLIEDYQVYADISEL